MNSTDMAYINEKTMLSFLDCECEEVCCELKDYDDAIEEYTFLLQNAIDIGNKKEIRILRADIQRCKAEKREFKRLIENNRMELVHT